MLKDICPPRAIKWWLIVSIKIKAEAKSVVRNLLTCKAVSLCIMERAILAGVILRGLVIPFHPLLVHRMMAWEDTTILGPDEESNKASMELEINKKWTRIFRICLRSTVHQDFKIKDKLITELYKYIKTLEHLEQWATVHSKTVTCPQTSLLLAKD